MNRTCSKCKVVQNINEFGIKRYKGKERYRSHCKTCLRIYRYKNKNKITAYNEEYRKRTKNKDIQNSCEIKTLKFMWIY